MLDDAAEAAPSVASSISGRRKKGRLAVGITSPVDDGGAVDGGVSTKEQG